MTEKIYLSPIASKTVDAKLQLLQELVGDGGIEDSDIQDKIRDLTERNDLELEETTDAPYA